ncbi:hypothetical protein KAI19_01435 [bacterium]|nr:hypothetical protein [bacterium]
MNRNIELTKQEKEVEDALMAGEFVSVDNKELEEIDKMGRPFGKQYTQLKRKFEGKQSELLLRVLAITFGTLSDSIFGHGRKIET